MYEELVKRLMYCRNNAAIITDEELVEIAEEAADAIEEPSKPRWISVTERLPEEEESVFVVRKFLGIKGQVPPSTYTENEHFDYERDYEPNPITNADRIRASDNEHLVEWFCRGRSCGTCPYGGVECGIRDWLKQEGE